MQIKPPNRLLRWRIVHMTSSAVKRLSWAKKIPFFCCFIQVFLKLWSRHYFYTEGTKMHLITSVLLNSKMRPIRREKLKKNPKCWNCGLQAPSLFLLWHQSLRLVLALLNCLDLFNHIKPGWGPDLLFKIRQNKRPRAQEAFWWFRTAVVITLVLVMMSSVFLFSCLPVFLFKALM